MSRLGLEAYARIKYGLREYDHPSTRTKEHPMTDNLTNDQLTQWDHDHFFHPSTHLGQFARKEIGNRIIKAANGVHITDREGRSSLDAFAGLYCVNAGYGRTEISDAISLYQHHSWSEQKLQEVENFRWQK